MFVKLSFLLIVVFVYNVDSARILSVFPFPSYSHQSVFHSILKTLHTRGHELVVITTNPIGDPSLKNLTEVDISLGYEYMSKLPLQELMSPDKTKITQLRNVHSYLYCDLLEYQMTQKNVVNFLNKKDENFDLVLVETFYPPLYALSYIYDAPVIGMASFPIPQQGHYSVGNPNHPVLNSDINFYYKNGMGFYERWDSAMYNLWQYYHYYYEFLPQSQEVAKRIFGEGIPDLYELERNVSMQFTYVNPFIQGRRPNVPAVLEFNMIHIGEASNKPLPVDLKRILDQSPEGVIYFSLGSNVKSTNIDKRLKSVIVKALSELPYKVIWKWDSDDVPFIPKNVVIQKWLPQQELLAHPNIKAFVTQGGLQSIEEAVVNTVPIVGLPFYGDQHMNIVKLAEAGITIHLEKDIVTKDELKAAIIEVATNKKYHEKMKEVKELFFDQPMKSLDTAIWWIEYVIRHKGARHLRSPSLDIPLYQYFLLDVIGVTLLVICLAIYLLYNIIKIIIRGVFGRQKKIKELNNFR